MDFRSPSAGSQPTHQAAPGVGAAKKSSDDSKWFRVSLVGLLACLTILVLAVIGVLAFGGNTGGSAQQEFVKNGSYQAVFLTNGQVYFGNIDKISSDYIQLKNIYYLTQNTSTDSKGQTTTDGNYTLVKLGCQQIHYPSDEMVIERAQVSFWENLNASGKVVTSIKQFQQQNPKGPDCSQVSNQTQASNNSNTQGSANNTTTTKP